MKRWSLSDVALDRPVTVGMALVALLLLGLIATFKLPLAFLPSESISRVQIRIDITRSSPEVLEREVIRPIEEQIAGVRDLRTMRVSSGSWGVRVHLEFEPGTDIDARKIELRERLDRARPNLPELVQNIDISSSGGPADMPVMRIQIAGPEDLSREYYLIEERVVRPIERVAGVSAVELSGVEPHQLEVAVDLQAADRSGIPVERVGQEVRAAHRARGLGVIRGSRDSTGVRSPSVPADPESFGLLPLERRPTDPAAAVAPAPATDAATPELLPTPPPAAPSAETRSFAPLSEVADVTLHPEERRRGSRLNGRPAVEIEVWAAAGSSVVEVTQEVRAVVEGMRSDPALGGIEVSVFEDHGERITETLGDLRDTGIYGGLFGALVLLLFLRRWRVTLTAAVCIPLAVLAACGVLFMRGEELNCVVLLGLVLGVGMLIDNAVVIVEAIQAQRQKGLRPLDAAREGAREVGLAVVASTMTSVIVFLPLLVGKQGNPMNDYLRPLGATFVTALLASLFVSQSVVPLAMGHLWRDEPVAVHHRLLDPIRDGYARLVRWTLRRPRTTVLVGLLISASAAFPAISANYNLGETEEKPDALPVRLEQVGSGDYRRVLEQLGRVEEALLVRRAELQIESIACDYRDWGGECDIYPAFEVENEHQMSAFEAAITHALPEQPSVRYHVGNNERHWRHMNRDPRVIDFALKGEDMGTLMALSEKVAVHLRERLTRADPDHPEAGGYDRVDGPFNEGSQEMHVVLDSARLQRLGLRADRVAELVSFAFQGAPLGRIRGEQGEVSLILSAGATRGDEGPDLADLRDLRIRLTTGEEVPLSGLARFELQRSPWWIQRVDRQTEIQMKVRYLDDDGEAQREEVQRALAEFPFPPGYSAGQGTQWWGDDKDAMEMVVNLGLCLLLVYAVMASLFESFLQPLGILVTCLLGCVGAPWAMFATRTTVDTVALIGMFILIGIVVNNGIMLVDKVTQLRAQGVPRPDALARAGRERLRPILMTASTTILGLVPMLLHHPTLAGIYYHSIAIIVAGGLITSTIMTLVFLPAAYTLIEDTAAASQAVWRRILAR
jgi:HAE1 family hydrophobic/amphiphilic exporter-1